MTERLVPDGEDMLDGLSVRELSIVSQQLKCDVAEAIGGDKDGKRWDAFPRVAWLWAKRQDPTAKLDPFFDMTAGQLMAALGADDDAEEPGEEPVEANPTVPAPASD